MKQLLQQYAAYNLWANKLLIDKASLLTPEALHQEISSSFNSIYKTFAHLTDVESTWWQRLKLVEHVETTGKNFDGNFEELSQQFLFLSRQWNDWVQSTNELNLTHVFAYQNSKKEQFKQPVYEMLLHLFNHQTYHRGQLVTMMRQVGVEKIPATDFIIFSRNKQGSVLKDPQKTRKVF